MGIITSEIGSSTLINNILVEISTEYENKLIEEMEKADISYKVAKRYKDEEESTSLVEVYIPLFVDKKIFWSNFHKILESCIYGRPRIVENLK